MFVIAVLNLAPNDIISQSCMCVTIVLLIISVGVVGNTCSMLSLGRWPRVMRHSQSLRNYQHAQRACLSWWVCLLHESSHLYTALHNSSVGQSLLFPVSIIQDTALTDVVLLLPCSLLSGLLSCQHTIMVCISLSRIKIISQLLTNIEDMIDPNLLQPYAKLDSPSVKDQHTFSL